MLGLLAVATVITSRPLMEMATLSEHYQKTERPGYLYAAETLRLYFEGTAWFVQTLLLVFSGLISAVLMLRSPAFGTFTQASLQRHLA